MNKIIEDQGPTGYFNTKENVAEAKPAGMPSKVQAEMVHRAIEDDEALADVANDIKVMVKHGGIILDGHVKTEQERNLATNTALAFGEVKKVLTKVDKS